MTDLTEILLELCGLPGPTGFETPVAERVRTMLEPYMSETWLDVMGNVIGVRRCGRENAEKLLFDAHIDENGLIVTGAEEGFLRFAALGGLDRRMLPASEVMLLTEPPIYGIIGALPPHVQKKEDAEKTVKIEDLYIDIGMDQDEAMRLVPVGTPAVFAQKARSFGDGLICGKALDDRSGFAAILKAVELLKDEPLNFDLYVMASVQEEAGTRGAGPGAFAIAPDWCAVVDVGHAVTPDSKTSEVNEKLGGGVIISVGPNMNRRLTDIAIACARDCGIGHQIDVEPGGNSGTNARVIQITRDGVATMLIGPPLRYMHSAFEVAAIEDIESTARLLCETAKALKGECGNA